MEKINTSALLEIVAMDINEFQAYGFEYKTEDGRKFFFMDNHAPVLAVAHLDTVINDISFSVNKKRKRMYSPMFDDRLGAYIILEHLLRELNYDVLLTVDEEIGKSTANSFNIGKEYNWIFSFDRKGSDVVMYQYDSPEMRKLLTKHNYEVGNGTFSDICYLEHLKCKAFNFGTGYHKQHTEACYADIPEVLDNINKFKKFCKAMHDVKLPHIPSKELTPGSAENTAVTYILTD